MEAARVDEDAAARLVATGSPGSFTAEGSVLTRFQASQVAPSSSHTPPNTSPYIQFKFYVLVYVYHIYAYIVCNVCIVYIFCCIFLRSI